MKREPASGGLAPEGRARCTRRGGRRGRLSGRARGRPSQSLAREAVLPPR